MQVAVLKESAARENRVALTPDSAGRLLKSKVDVVVQRGAGERAGFPDDAYATLGVRIAADAASMRSFTRRTTSSVRPSRNATTSSIIAR